MKSDYLKTMNLVHGNTDNATDSKATEEMRNRYLCGLATHSEKQLLCGIGLMKNHYLT